MITDLSSIDAANEISWNGKTLITFDQDWVHDEVMEDTFNILRGFKVNCVVFVTHKSDILKDLQNDKKIEIGIHPNFTHGDKYNNNFYDNCKLILDNYLTFVQDCKFIRSHNLTQNSRLMELFFEKGIQFDLNDYIPYSSGIELKPWKIWNGLTKIPFFWEDDLDFCRGNTKKPGEYLQSGGIRVFNFHPIHIYLNSRKISNYEKTREYLDTPNKLKLYRENGYGVRNFFEDLLSNLENSTQL